MTEACSVCEKPKARSELYVYPFFGYDFSNWILICNSCSEKNHELSLFGKKSRKMWMEYMTELPAWKDRIPHHCWQCEKTLIPKDIWLFQSGRDPKYMPHCMDCMWKVFDEDPTLKKIGRPADTESKET